METQFALVEEEINTGLYYLGLVLEEYTSLECLVSIRNQMVSMSAEEALSKNQAKAINIAIEALFKSKQNNLAIEDFKSTYNAHINTRLSLESIKDKVKEMISKIIEWIKKAVEWVLHALTGFDDIYNSIGDRALELNNRSQRLKDTAPNIKAIKNNKLANFFSKTDRNRKTNSLYTEKEISDLYTKHTQTTSPMFCVYFVKNLIKEIDVLTKDIRQSKGMHELLKEIDLLISKIINDRLIFLHKDSSTTEDNKTIVKYSHDFEFGDHILNCETISIDNKFKSIDFSVSKYPESLRLPENTLLPVLSISAIKDLTNKIQNEMLFGNIRNTKQITKDIKNLQVFIELTLKELELQDRSDEKEDLLILNFVKDITNSILVVVNLMYKYDAKVASNILDYCDGSIKCY